MPRLHGESLGSWMRQLAVPATIHIFVPVGPDAFPVGAVQRRLTVRWPGSRIAPVDHALETTPVELNVHGNADVVQHGRQDVDRSHLLADLAARRNDAWTVEDERHEQELIIEIVPMPQTSLRRIQVLAVIRREHDERAIEQV